jgi:hypothetical protein
MAEDETSGNLVVSVRTTPEIIQFLNRLAKIGIHGKTKTDVARYLISNGIERLAREGFLKLPDEE